MTDAQLRQLISEHLERTHSRSAATSFHLLTNADRDYLAEKHGRLMVAAIRHYANDPSWVWPKNGDSK